jgi:hypothetical protein
LSQATQGKAYIVGLVEIVEARQICWDGGVASRDDNS